MIGFIVVALISFSLVLLLKWYINSHPTNIAFLVKRLVLVLAVILLTFLMLSGRLGSIMYYGGFIIPFFIPIFFRLYKNSDSPNERPHLNQNRGQEEKNSYNSKNITAEEACEMLGVSKDASRDDIIHAYRRLMLKLHPDHGGTDYLAQKLNQAKEILIKRIRQKKG